MSAEYKTLIAYQQIEKKFCEIEPSLNEAEAIFESNRCLYCYDAPCTIACPTHIDVPSFIKKISSGNLLGAARVIFDANPIGSTCARVCPVEVLCVGACVEKTLMHQPIQIGRLQRYATDFVIEKKQKLFKSENFQHKAIAIVGSGPSGLSCGTYLVRLGYDVDIYERRSLAGGLDTYGMAEYKMTQQSSLNEVDLVEQLGVNFLLNKEIGKDILFTDLENKYDAIFLGIGLGATRKLNLLGEELPRIYDALDFIELVKTRNWTKVPIGKVVVVIGAGNTAIDAATQAKRLGAERVIIVYRRSEQEMSAYQYEYELAKKDGIEFFWNTAPVEIISSGEKLKLRCEKTNLINSEFHIDVDIIIKAIGQSKQISILEKIEGLRFDNFGRVIVDEETMQTSNAKYFAGGDCVNGGSEAVNAAQHGKLAAQGIHKMLTGEIIKFAGAI